MVYVYGVVKEESIKTKMIFISCRSEFLDNDRVYPPLAGLYLKSYIEDRLPNVQFDVTDEYDLNNLDMFDSYDFVGISIMTPQREEAYKILHAIKSKYPNKKVIAGGPHVKHYLSDVVNEPFDFIIPLDGEEALLSVLKGKSQRIITSTLSREQIANAPRPDRTSKVAKELLSHYHYSLKNREATTIMMARGCPMSCGFCEEAGTQVRWSSLDNIKAELDDIKALGYGAVYIFDDLFAISKVKAEPICNELKKRDLIYRCNGHAKYMTDDFMKMLADTGCAEIMFGAESGSQKILDIVNKKTTVQQNYKFVELCNKYHITCKAFLMIGLPGETYETIAETEKFISTGGITDFQLAIYYPYVGTPIRNNINDYDLFIECEGLGAYGQKGGSTESTVRTAALSSQDLMRERDRLVNTYRPQSHTTMWEDKK